MQQGEVQRQRHQPDHAKIEPQGIDAEAEEVFIWGIEMGSPDMGLGIHKNGIFLPDQPPFCFDGLDD